MQPTKRTKTNDGTAVAKGGLPSGKRMAKWGSFIDGVYMDATPSVKLPEAAPMVGRYLLRDSAVPSDRCTSGVVDYERKPLHLFGTPRVAQQGSCRALTVRGQHDYATQLRYLEDYVKAFPDPKDRGCTPNPTHVEWLQGLERGWTSTSDDIGVCETKPPPNRLRCIDLFTGK